MLIVARLREGLMSSTTVSQQSVQQNAPQWWRIALPLAIIAVIAALPPPQGLEQHTWYYFAIFAGVIHQLIACPWRPSSPILQNLIIGTHRGPKQIK
jgi:hypothetical protein